MQIGGFNSEHITNLANQLKNNTDPDVIKIISAQHSKQIQDILSAISKEQSTLSKSMPPITKVPIPNQHTRALTKWANKVAAGVAMPQVKAQAGYAAHLAAASSAISTISGVLKDLRESISKVSNIAGDIKRELLAAIDGASPQTDETSKLIDDSITNIMTTLASNQDALNQITGGSIQVDASSVNNFVNSINAYSTSVDSALTTLFSATPPAIITIPVITGNASVGQSLTSTPGSWSGTTPITYYYRWQRNGIDIPGANVSTYTLVADDRATPVRCAVSAENLSSEVTVYSANTANVIMLPENVRLPAILGALGVANTLTADAGQWYSIRPIGTPAYQWYANTTPISGANTSTFVITVTQQGSTIKVKVTITNADGSVSANSAPTATIP